MLKLLGQPASINVRKVLWTCAEIGVPFDHELWGGATQSPQTPAFLALNPNGMVPVIADDGLVLWESNVICRYLAARHGRDDLLPGDARQRALVEQWMDWQAGELNNSWRYAFMALVRRSPAHTDAAAIAAGTANWHRHIGMLDAQLARGGPFVTGATFTLADVVLGLSVNRWIMTPLDDRPAFAAVAGYYARLSERPAFLLHGRNGIA